MSSTNLRAIVAQGLGRVCDDRCSLDDVIEVLSPSLDKQQHGLFRAMMYGGIRWNGVYGSRLNSYLKKPFKPKDRCLHHLLVSAFYQIDFLQIAPHAVVNETVAASKDLNRVWAKALVNGVLRSALRANSAPPATAKELRQCFPVWFHAELRTHWPQQQEVILTASNQKPPMSLRINQQRTSREDYLARLAELGLPASPCEFSREGIKLERGISVTELPGFMQGDVSVQDESAQLAVPLLALESGQRVLDACAAPGGKTAHIMEQCLGLEEVVAVDFAPRLGRFQDNMARLSLEPTVVVGDTTELETWWDGRPFDRVLLDVPCSGTGVIRRHPDIRFRRQAADIEKFTALQWSLLEAAWHTLKPEGLLLYTTCSILPAENEQLIARFVEQSQHVAVKTLPEWLGIDTGSGRQRLGGVHSGDGFYYALLQKMGTLN